MLTVGEIVALGVIDDIGTGMAVEVFSALVALGGNVGRTVGDAVQVGVGVTVAVTVGVSDTRGLPAETVLVPLPDADATTDCDSTRGTNKKMKADERKLDNGCFATRV